jgi:hypothetical protein
MAKNQLDGKKDGDTVWLCFPSVEVGSRGAAKARAWVHEATVFSAEHGLVLLGGEQTPRGVHKWCETVHGTAAEAWGEAAAFMRKAAEELLAKATEFDEVSAKIAARVEAA